MISIIDYNCGNIASLCYALDKLKAKYIVTNDKDVIWPCDKVIFPWVWNASYAMEQLRKLDLINTIRNYKKPFLGICLWMQLLFQKSEEWNTKCLWIMPWKIVKFIDNTWEYRIPHTWWNSIKLKNWKMSFLPQDKKKLRDDDLYYYFVHSYYAPVWEYTTSICNYIHNFSASVQYKNFCGVQFHPEKSIENWLNFLKQRVEST